MEGSTTAIIVACITGGITAFGWTVSHVLIRSREDRIRGIELRIAELDRKYEELYGPLYSLIQQVLNAWDVRENLAKGISTEDSNKARMFIWREYFSPLHSEIRDLLKTKLYLVNEGAIPESFKIYLEHATQELFRNRLNEELGVDVNHVKHINWPSDFPRDVEKEIEKIMLYRQEIVQKLNVAYKLKDNE